MFLMCIKVFSYPQVVVCESRALSLPQQRDGEERRDVGVAGVQHHGCLQAGW